MPGAARGALLAAFLATLPAALIFGGPAPARAECGGDAVSSGVVVEHRAPRRGPVVAAPETLCADVDDADRPRVTLDLYDARPARAGTPGGAGDGARPGTAPYAGTEDRVLGRSPPPSR